MNTVAWLYIFLPCTIVGGLYLTIRNRGIQFTRFGYAMKNTVGKMFQKQGGRRGRRHPAAGRYHGAGRDGRHGQHRRHVAGHRPRRLWRGVLAVARGAARHDHQSIPRSRSPSSTGNVTPRATGSAARCTMSKWPRQGLAVGRNSVRGLRGDRLLRHRQHVAGQLHRWFTQQRNRRLYPRGGGERNLLNLIFGIVIAGRSSR